MNDLAPFAASHPLGIRDLVDSCAMVGESRTGSKRFWTNREQAVLREQFPTGGINACLPLLPGRTAGSIYQQAQRLELRVLNAAGTVTERRVYKTTPQIDAAIQHAFSGRVTIGAIKRLSKTLWRPRTWVSKRALALGCAVPRFKEAPWSEAELDILRANADRHPDTTRRALKRAGYRRTATAVVLKLKGLRIVAGAGDSETYTSVALAEAFGVTRGVVGGWIEKEWLAGARQRAKAPGTLGKEPHDKALWAFTRKEVRAFVIDNVGVIDFRKVDKFWLVNLLTEIGG